MLDDHGRQGFFKVLGPVCFITIKYTSIADSVPTVNTHYEYPARHFTPLEAYLTGRFSYDFRHWYCTRQQTDYSLGFLINFWSDCGCAITIPIRARTFLVDLRQ